MLEPLHRVVVTGASGFVGRALCARLPASVDTLSFGAADWRTRLDGAHLEGATVFHLAARVHSRGAQESEFVADNVEKTRALAESAAREGARRFVFLSTAKVYGEESGARPFRVGDAPAPQDAYARSKVAAEEALGEISREARLPVTTVRAPLVYGASARANLEALLRLADTPLPLPFAALTAQRSFVHVDDLVRLLLECAQQPQAAGRTYNAAHAEGFSTANLVASMRAHLGRARRLYALPAATIETLSALVGQRERALRLTRPLVIDAEDTHRELRWTARVPIDQAIEELVRDFRARHPQ